MEPGKCQWILSNSFADHLLLNNLQFNFLLGVASVIFLCVHTAVVVVFTLGGAGAALADHHGPTGAAEQLSRQQIVILRLKRVVKNL